MAQWVVFVEDAVRNTTVNDMCGIAGYSILKNKQQIGVITPDMALDKSSDVVLDTALDKTLDNVADMLVDKAVEIQVDKPALLSAMANAMIQRGPDAEGFWNDERVGLAHRRLSILDLSTGQQPMVSGDLVVVFNGEIYNFLSIRRELEEAGVRFGTASDTEVLLLGYRQWGIDLLLQKLEGMFAFALYDASNGILVIARDRFGEKPLYYGEQEGVFYFGSEIKSLKAIGLGKKLDKQALSLYLQLSYIPAPFSIYQEVRKLEAGCYLTVADSISHHRYYDIKEAVKQKRQELVERLDWETAAEQEEFIKSEIRRMLKRSVSEKMQSDVAVGTFLSGGVDSSIVSYLVKSVLEESDKESESTRIMRDEPMRTFSIGFAEKSFDESQRSGQMATVLGSEHYLKTLDYDDVLPQINTILGYFDEPFGDSSCLPSAAVAALAREQVSVVLTGDCADELFGGYEKYLFSHYTHSWAKVPSILQSGIRRVVNVLPTNPRFNPIVRKFKKVDSLGRFSDSELSYRLMCMGFQPEELQELLVDSVGKAGQDGIGIEGQKKGGISAGHDNAIKGVTSEVDGTSVGGGNLDSAKGLRGGASVGVLDNYLDNSWEEGESDFLNNSMLRDVQVVLEGDMLVKVDRMCMMHSLEARVPFLERELVEFALALPSDWKITGKERKWILREAFRGMVPDDILDNSKKGFGVPVDFWFRGPLKHELQRLLSKEKIEKQGLFRWDSVQRLVNEHLDGTHNHKGKLWNLFVFQHWYERQAQDI